MSYLPHSSAHFFRTRAVVRIYGEEVAQFALEFAGDLFGQGSDEIGAPEGGDDFEGRHVAHDGGAGEHLYENQTQGKDVAGFAQCRAAGLLGGHVRRGAGDAVGLGR